MARKKRESNVGSKKKKKSSLVFFLMIVLLVVLVLLVPILLFQLGLVNNVFANLHIKQQEFIIEDECSMIVGNLIHTIENAGVCDQKCKNECSVRDLFYYDSEFIEKVGDCHECKCYCR